jgi:uncharacterized protein YqhQ
MSEKLYTILFYLGITLAQIFIFSAILLGINSNCGDKVVNCYDRNYNVIIGQTCQQHKVDCVTEGFQIIVIIIASIIFLLVNYFVILYA